MLKVCIDTNVWISGLLFSGPSSCIVDLALEKQFELSCSKFILIELERNLINKFNLDSSLVEQFLEHITLVASFYEPKGTINVVKEKHADNLILETALLGNSEFLITGDKKHLLPLKEFSGIKIISPSEFIKNIYKT